MGEANSTASRRGLLGRALVLAGGAAGLQVGGTSAATATTALQFYASGLHLHSPTHRPGQVPGKGERFSAYAELSAAPSGRSIGHFTASFLALDSPFSDGAVSEEQHTFHLADGTIIGSGSTVRGLPAEFAVVGGTGRYRGARGWYSALQHPHELGGNGTAEFHLTLVG